ncbi:MAG: class I SAM-dependent methyltransferase [Bacilli bacterium]|nr:class I SAM-dependent methyltransferase [Bacilli bacterium]
MSHYYDREPTSISNERFISFEIYDKKITLITDNGVFSKNKVDEGSLYFLRTIIPLDLGNKILDLGCGYGTIGLTIATFKLKASIDLADINTRALALCERNAQNLNVKDRVNIICSDVYSNIKDQYESIVVNPPIRAGKIVTYAMYEGAKQRLIDGGCLYVVIRKAQGADSASEYIKELFGNVEMLDRHKGYHVYRAMKTQN